MSLDKRLKELREDLGFATNQEYAIFLDYKHSTLNYTLRGETEPKVGLVITLLNKVENLNPYWLLMGNGKKYTEGEKPVRVKEIEQKSDNQEQKRADRTLKQQGQIDLLKELLIEKERVAEKRNMENHALASQINQLASENEALKTKKVELIDRLIGYGDEGAKKEKTGA